MEGTAGLDPEEYYLFGAYMKAKGSKKDWSSGSGWQNNKSVSGKDIR